MAPQTWYETMLQNLKLFCIGSWPDQCVKSSPLLESKLYLFYLNFVRKGIWVWLSWSLKGFVTLIEFVEQFYWKSNGGREQLHWKREKNKVSICFRNFYCNCWLDWISGEWWIYLNVWVGERAWVLSYRYHFFLVLLFLFYCVFSPFI